MTNSNTAFTTISKQYDLDTLREIFNHGCISGVANHHIYYHQTVSFFDDNEEEIVEYVSDNLGEDYLVEVFKNSNADLTSYKNDICWCFVELVAGQLIDEFESTTLEELSNLDDNVYDELKALSETEWGRDHLELVSL
tara:strand:+ start:630 stop:1043 length:414 start_codon:yes stop_codon:yes gene_type:complete